MSPANLGQGSNPANGHARPGLLAQLKCDAQHDQGLIVVPDRAALVRGYLETARFLTKAEKQFLAFSGKLITFEIGIRFLADFLAGDTYFKVHRDGHNLDRCRTQFKLVESIESQEKAMQKYVDGL